MTQGDFGAVSAQLRAGAEGLSPGASGMSAWLRERATALETTSAMLGKALADHRALPTDAAPEVLRVLTVVRRYRVAVAGDAVLDVADELEELARALLADGDRQLAWAFCELADRIDEGLQKAYADHPGWDLLPSKLNPRVKRWQRVTTVNAADTPGDAQGRVDPERDWADRHRARLRALQELLDEHLARLVGRRPRGRHRRGVGVYQGSTEATSLSQYPDPDGKVFEKGLGAIAAVGLAYRQKEVFLNREFPADCEDEARQFAAAAHLDEPLPVMAVKLDASPEVILGSIRRYAESQNIPGMTILQTDDGAIQVRFMLFNKKERSRVASLLNVVSRVASIQEVAYGWSVSRSTGDEDNLAAAISNHRDILRKHGYSMKEIARLEEGRAP